MKTCPQCRTRAADDELFCQNCGRKLVITSCPQCGHPSGPDDAFCEKCGASLGAGPAFNHHGESTPSNGATIARPATGGPVPSSRKHAPLALVLSIISAALCIAAIFLFEDLPHYTQNGVLFFTVSEGVRERMILVYGLLGGSGVAALVAVVLGALAVRQRRPGKRMAIVALLLATAALGSVVLTALDLGPFRW